MCFFILEILQSSCSNLLQYTVKSYIFIVAVMVKGRQIFILQQRHLLNNITSIQLTNGWLFFTICHIFSKSIQISTFESRHSGIKMRWYWLCFVNSEKADNDFDECLNLKLRPCMSKKKHLNVQYRIYIYTHIQ